MRILHISDWHCDTRTALSVIKANRLHEQPVDLLLVTGDMLTGYLPTFARVLPQGPQMEARNQRAEWLKMAAVFRQAWPGASMVAVPGNHDYCKLAIPRLVRSFDEHRAQTIRVRGLRITGFRGTELFTGTWHGEQSDESLARMVRQLDPKADIVVTHLAPYGILDRVNESRRIGNLDLAEWCLVHAPKVHAFGHVHESGGLVAVKDMCRTKFSNAACRFNWLVLPD